MLSFELSVIDVVLIIAIIILFSLHLTRTSKKFDVRSKLNAGRQRSLEEKEMEGFVSETPERKAFLAEEKVPGQCSYHFGHLSSISQKRDSIPEECYSCPKMMRCLYSTKEQDDKAENLK
jgi:hypothetical protein